MLTEQNNLLFDPPRLGWARFDQKNSPANSSVPGTGKLYIYIIFVQRTPEKSVQINSPEIQSDSNKLLSVRTQIRSLGSTDYEYP